MMRRILAWLVLLASLVLPPVGLVVLGFDEWGSLSWNSPTDIRLLLAALTIIGWIAWVAWLVVVAVEWVTVGVGRPAIALPGLRWGQALAGTILAAALASGIPGPALATPATPGEAGPAQAPPATTTSGVSHAGDSSSVEEQDASADGADAGGQTSASGAPRNRVIHTVQEGDDLWSLAERYYGEGTKWRTIVAANPDLQEDPTANLSVGTQLRMDRPIQLVTVTRGDTLSGLAEQYLGDPDRWTEIEQLNRDRVADPDVIDIGWVLRVPLIAEPVPEAPPESTPDVPEASDSVDQEPQESTDPPAAPGGPSPLGEAGGSSGSGIPVGQGSGDRVPAGVGEETPPSTAAFDQATLSKVVGGLTTMTASVVLGGVVARRRLQAHGRPVGRRFSQPSEAESCAESALGVMGSREPDREDLLDLAMRHLSAYWLSHGLPSPSLVEAVLGDIDLEFTFRSDPGIPDGFQHVENRLAIAWSRIRELPPCRAPVAYPALVTLGEDERGHLVMVDLVTAGVTGIRGDVGQVAAEALSAMLVELACAPWAAELRLLVVTEDEGFTHVAGSHRVRTTRDVGGAIEQLEHLIDVRRRSLAQEDWGVVRLHPDRADAWAPHIVLFERVLTDEQIDHVDALVEGSDCGIAAVLPVGAGGGEAAWEVSLGSEHAEVRSSAGRELAAQTLPEPTREAIGQLYTLADAEASERAPWWAKDPEDPVDIIEIRPAPLVRRGPEVLLLGPIELVGARGERPARAVRQCVEYCAWLLEHPGGTATEMGGQLFVADATRRSNLSRLRAWLGSASDGSLFLPDAYSGRIHLHEAVSSDWQLLREMTAGGINRMPFERLRLALELVRGAPLADASPGQWGWAEEMRSDMSALIRDLGVIAARIARERGDLDASRWAANRALVAAPDDELLLGERIRTEQASGRGDDVERLVKRIHRHARLLEVDLLPQTIDLIQEVMEGRIRSRRA